MGADCSTIQKCAGSDTSAIKPVETTAVLSYPKARRGSKSKEGEVSRADSKESTSDKVEKKKDKIEKKIDKIRVEKNYKRLRKVAIETAGEINHFAVFLKRTFPTMDKAFDAIAGKARAHVDYNVFAIQLEKHGFTGNVDRVFYGLCDDKTWDKGAILTRGAFVKRISSIGSPFVMVVQQTCLRNREKIKKKVMEHMKEKNRDQDLIDQFRTFVEPRYPTPGKAFDAIAGDDGCIDEEEFVEWLGSMGYPGDAAAVFHNFCDADGYILRTAFSEILVREKTEVQAASPPRGLQRSGTIAWGAGKDASAEERDMATAGNPQEPLDMVAEKRKDSKSDCEEAPAKAKASKRRSTISRAASKEKQLEQDSPDETDANKDSMATSKAKRQSRSSSKEKLLEKGSPNDATGEEDATAASKTKRSGRPSSKEKSPEKGSPDDKEDGATTSKVRRLSKSSSMLREDEGENKEDGKKNRKDSKADGPNDKQKSRKRRNSI